MRLFLLVLLAKIVWLLLILLEVLLLQSRVLLLLLSLLLVLLLSLPLEPTPDICKFYQALGWLVHE